MFIEDLANNILEVEVGLGLIVDEDEDVGLVVEIHSLRGGRPRGYKVLIFEDLVLEVLVLILEDIGVPMLDAITKWSG